MIRKPYFPLVFLCVFLLTGCPENYFEERALRIHERVLTVDSHVDTPLFIYYQDLDLGEYHDPYEINRKIDFAVDFIGVMILTQVQILIVDKKWRINMAINR